MAGIPITFACGLYDRTLPLYTGEIKPDGIDFNYLVIDNPREIFDRMGGAQEFEASEMSSSDFVRRFTERRLSVRGAAGVRFARVPPWLHHGRPPVDTSPKDLAGKRIGVPLYPMTAAIFIRGLLQHDFGVDLSGVTWVEGAINEAKPHGNPTKLPFAKPIAIEANNRGKSLSDLLEAGDIQAIIGAGLPDAINRNPNIAAAVSGLSRAREGLLSAARRSSRSCILS